MKFNEKALRQIAEEAVKDVAKDLQRDMDGIHRTYAGRPVQEVKSAIQMTFRRNGRQITDPQLSAWGQLISDGTRIEFVPGEATGLR